MDSKKILINGSEIKIIPTPFDGKLSIENYEKQLYSALLKIGVKEKYITISKENEHVTIHWEINNELFKFSCIIYQTYRENLGACVQAIKEDVRHILRGIKDINLVLKQYSTNEKTNTKKKKNIFDFENNNENNKKIHNSVNKNKEKKISVEILNENHAKQIIDDIKKKYPNYSNYSYLPDYERVQLEKATIYLGKKPHWK